MQFENPLVREMKSVPPAAGFTPSTDYGEREDDGRGAIGGRRPAAPTAGATVGPLRADEKLLLLAHPRSGSSNLYEILQMRPTLEICHEPFNENRTSWAPGNKNYRGAN